MNRAVVIGAGILATITAVSIVVLTVAIVGDSTARIAGLSAWSGFATAILTALLTVGAFLTAVGLVEQINEARRGREAVLRPVLILTRAGSGEGVSDIVPVVVGIANIGPGPALSVTIRGWGVRGEDVAEVPGDRSAWQEMIERERGSIDLAAPWYEQMNPSYAIGPGQTDMVSLGFADWDTNWRLGENDRLYYVVDYLDVFGNRFSEPESGAPGPRRSSASCGRRRSAWRRASRSPRWYASSA